MHLITTTYILNSSLLPTSHYVAVIAATKRHFDSYLYLFRTASDSEPHIDDDVELDPNLYKFDYVVPWQSLGDDIDHDKPSLLEELKQKYSQDEPPQLKKSKTLVCEKKPLPLVIRTEAKLNEKEELVLEIVETPPNRQR